MPSGKESDQCQSSGTTSSSTSSTGETHDDAAILPMKHQSTNSADDEKQKLISENKMKVTEETNDIPHSNGTNETKKDFKDPVNILQFSQDSDILVLESLDDDGQSIIPPSPEALRSTPLVIPSTPSLPEDCGDLGEDDGDDLANSQKRNPGLQRRITFSQESQDQTPLTTRQGIAERMKQFVSEMKGSECESATKRLHVSESSLDEVSPKKRKEDDHASKIASQPSPIGGRTYKMLSRYDRASSSSPRPLLSEKKRLKPSNLFGNQESEVPLEPRQQQGHVDTPEMDFKPMSSSSGGKDDDDSWSLRLTGVEPTQMASTPDTNSSDIRNEEGDKVSDLQRIKIFRCLKQKYRDSDVRRVSSNGHNDSSGSQENSSDVIRIFRPVSGRRHPVIASQSQEDSTEIYSPLSSSTKRVHSEDESRRFNRPKTCNTSVQTDEESPLTDQDTPNTSTEVAKSKPKYHRKLKEEHTTYLLTCMEDGTVVSSTILRTNTVFRMITEEEVAHLFSSSGSSTSTSLVSHLSSLASGEMADVSSFPSSKSTSTSSLHSLQQTGSSLDPSNLDHSKDSNKSPNTSTEKHAPVQRGDSFLSSGTESPALRDELFPKPLKPAGTRKIPAFQPPSCDSSSTSSAPEKAERATPTRPFRVKRGIQALSKTGSVSSGEALHVDDTCTAENLVQSPSSPELTFSRGDILPDAKSPSPVDLCPGLKVMAKWKDEYFYLGEIKGEETSSLTSCKCWPVLFYDGFTRNLGEGDVFPFDLIREGQSVFARSSANEIEPGVVQRFFRNNEEEGLIVDLDSGASRRCSRADIVLSSDQAASLINRNYVCTDTTSVTLDNIVDGKRRRTPVVTTPKRSRKPDPNLETTASSDASDDIRKTPLSRHKGKSHSEKRDGQKVKTRLYVQLHSPTRTSPRKMSPLGVKADSTIFEGLAFLMSCTARTRESFEPNLTSSSEYENTSNRVCEVEPFDKKELQSTLEAGGGIVLDSFESAQLVVDKKVILLTNMHLRTLKYIECLAAGIPCINISWVKVSLREKKCQEFEKYYLPAGYSIIKKDVLDWHGRSTVLKDLHILLVSRTNREFVATWKQVLLAARAEAVYRLISSELNERTMLVDMVVTDHSCPENVLNLARNLKIPVVSSEWVVQCLVNGRRLPPTAHAKFGFDYR